MNLTRARRMSAVTGAACLCLLAVARPLCAQALETPRTVSSSALVESPATYDGRRVAFEGEAIGEVMLRGESAWIHLNDDAYMYKNVEEGAELGGLNSGMPVWLPAEEAGSVSVFGDYKHEGDVVRVVGVFNAACAQHGGDTDIHASRLEVLIPGRSAADPVKSWKPPLAGVLAVGAALAFAAQRRLMLSEPRRLFRRP